MIKADKKLCLVMVDSLHPEMLKRAVAAGKAPHFGALIERGVLIEDCVSAFPSVTPVCCSEIATGTSSERHGISGMNWYHRVEERYVEYGSSFEATRAFGLFRATYDIVYNMNMAHLSSEVETVFESLGDIGVRTACTPFLIYRGRTRHQLGLEGLLRRGAVAAGFRHAVWGPDELFYGELFSSRPVPCKPTLARPGTRDEYSACVSKELVADDAYDFLLFSLPDNDHHTHRVGPDNMGESIAHADHCFGELVEAVGGMDRFLETHALILMADHAQTDVDNAYPIAETLSLDWKVLQPSSDEPSTAELAVSPTARAAAVYVLTEPERRAQTHAGVRDAVSAMEGTDLLAWVADGDGEAIVRGDAGAPAGCEPGGSSVAIVQRDGRELCFRPGEDETDLRSAGWTIEGDLSVLELSEHDGVVSSEEYPDALGRLWSALTAPHAGDLLISLAEGWDCVDWGATSHVGGGSHGSLRVGDSNAPLILAGFEPGVENRHRQWRLCDVAALVREHFGAPDPYGEADRPLAGSTR